MEPGPPPPHAVIEQHSSLSENVTKHIQDLDTENHKPLMKEWKEDLNKWRDIPCSSVLKFTTAKMSILSKLIYGFNIIPIKISTRLFLDIHSPSTDADEVEVAFSGNMSFSLAYQICTFRNHQSFPHGFLLLNQMLPVLCTYKFEINLAGSISAPYFCV